ncbi:DUF3857 domain-containing transglutaminase family protein [uncultured Sphingomonas sp.]|uniref:DUF3857 domain-containing transglutaminase family protein n=1 Tax=uncultured Sphingomonas sp. TaxID=158754 RepID=UPI0025FA69B8|nr:DUF3857 domain-containing transglutaminase family protein [uncultured Sphingomonas sp.]
MRLRGVGAIAPALALVSVLAAGGAGAQNAGKQAAKQAGRPAAAERGPQTGPVPAWVTRSEPLAVPADASGPVFMRRQDVVAHITGQGQAQYMGYRIKVLQSNALQIGNIAIAWDPAAGPPIVHAIHVIRDGQTIDAMKAAAFEVLRREDKLEEAMLDGTLTAVLRVPDLRVGDELEVEWTTFAKDPTMGGKASGLLVLAASPAPGRYHLGLNWDAGHKPQLKISPDMTAALKTQDQGVDFRFDNPATLTPPKDAPPRYQWQRIVEYSDFADWPSVSRHFAPLYTRAATLSLNSPLRQEAARIAAASPKPLDRAAAALKLVQQDVRYIYVGLNGGNLTPASADETWQRRYGDCKGKTALLLALLRELGIEAEAVLINSNAADDGFDQRLSGPQLFDHVLVRAHIDGATYWLDGTMPAVVPPAARPVFPVQWVLPLTTRGESLEKLNRPLASVPDETTLYDIDTRAGFDKPAKITSTTITRGVAGLQQQAQFSAVTPGQMLDAFRQQLTGEFWQAIDSVQWRYDPKAQASILTIAGTGTVDWDKDDDGGRSFALPGGGFSPPDRRGRSADQPQDVPFYSKPEYSCHVTTVRLPTGTDAKQWSSKPSFDTMMFGRHYRRAWEMRDGTIRMVRGSRVEQPEIDAAMAARDNGRIDAFDNSMAWIFYAPKGTKPGVGQGEAVPASYDHDWIGDPAPCMPTAKGV